MDPVSIVISSAAVGAVAGKFIEKAWNLGEKWINEYFQNHGKEAQQKARENAFSLLSTVGRSEARIDITIIAPKFGMLRRGAS